MSLKNAKPGDRVLYQALNPKREPREGWTIESLARVWGTAIGPYGHKVKFRIDTGHEDGRGYAPPGRILTPQMVEHEQRVLSAKDALRKLGLAFMYGEADRFTPESLEAAAEALRAGRKGDA